MLTVLLMICLGMQLGVPAWYYIICGLILLIDVVIKLGVQIHRIIEKNRIKWIDVNPQ